MRILALDLATKTGWTYSDGATLLSGVQDCSVRSRESRGMLYVRFRAWLRAFVETTTVDLVVYEQPHTRGSSSVAVGLETCIHELHADIERGEVKAPHFEYTAGHKSSVMKAILGTANPGGIKRVAPKGALRTANKAASMAWAEKRLGRPAISDDEADALMLIEWARLEYGGERPVWESGNVV